MAPFDLPGALRRVRRIADMSQRELARAAGLSSSTVGHAESGTRDLPVRVLARIVELAHLRLAIVDDAGVEVEPMRPDAVRDRANRRFPAHLDTRHSDEGWWHGPHRYDREQPSYTFDRDRWIRDAGRALLGTPSDHRTPEPGDTPRERAAARRHEQRRARAAELERRFLSGELRGDGDVFTCTCPAACDELDDWSGRPVHTEDCPCSCDLG